MISLRVFEFSVGPESATLLRLDAAGDISGQLNAIGMGLAVAPRWLHDAKFYRVSGGRLDPTLLDVATPLSALALGENDILIARLRCATHPAAVPSVPSRSSAADLSEGRSTLGSPAAPPHLPMAAGASSTHPASKGDGGGGLAQNMLGLTDAAAFRRRCAVEVLSGQHLGLASRCAAALEAAAGGHSSPLAAPPPPLTVAEEMALHAELLGQFVQRCSGFAEAGVADGWGLLAVSHSTAAAYGAIYRCYSMRCEDGAPPLPGTVRAVQEVLAAIAPGLSPAATLLCVLYHGAEYAAILSLVRRALTAEGHQQRPTPVAVLGAAREAAALEARLLGATAAATAASLDAEVADHHITEALLAYRTGSQGG